MSIERLTLGEYLADDQWMGEVFDVLLGVDRCQCMVEKGEELSFKLLSMTLAVLQSAHARSKEHSQGPTASV